MRELTAQPSPVDLGAALEIRLLRTALDPTCLRLVTWVARSRRANREQLLVARTSA